MALRFVALSLAVLGTGCASSAVDLVAVPTSGSTAEGTVQYTDAANSKLTLKVLNQGKALATSSPVIVEFFLRNSTVTSPVKDGGQIDAGQTSSVLAFEIPQACTDGGCNFRITVDPERQQKESNRSNNVVLGECVGLPRQQVDGLLGPH
jgi:subtilase family serine protease